MGQPNAVARALIGVGSSGDGGIRKGIARTALALSSVHLVHALVEPTERADVLLVLPRHLLSLALRSFGGVREIRQRF